MLVPEHRYEEAVAIAAAVAESSTVGRSDDPAAFMGPLVSQVQWDRVQTLLKKGVAEGARVVTGGPGKPEGLEDGYFVKPTIFADVNNQMSIAQEEIFGPVLSVIPYSTEAEAIEIANDTICKSIRLRCSNGQRHNHSLQMVSLFRWLEQRSR